MNGGISIKCSRGDCLRTKILARGLCKAHYLQDWKAGRFKAQDARQRGSLPHRFWSKVAVCEADENNCWNWLARTNGTGYGTFKFEGRQVTAHRMAWLLTHSVMPQACVLHACDNPRCVNPGHLFLGSHAENMADMVRKGRSKTGESCGKSKLRDLDIPRIRTLADKMSYSAVGRLFGVTAGTISAIKQGITWRHV